MKSAVLICFAALCAFSRVFAGVPVSPDELAIYKILFAGNKTVLLEVPGANAKPAPDVTPDPKYEANFSAHLKKKFPSAEDSTIAAFVSHRPLPATLPANSDVGVKLEFIDEDTVSQIFSTDKTAPEAWAELKQRYPVGGYTFVTRVSFNPAHTQAFVFILTAFGPTSTDAYTVYLEKRDGKWVEAGREEDRVS